MENKPEERGQALTEYALLFVLVVIVVILVLGLLGDAIENLWSDTIIPLMEVFTESAAETPP